MQTQADLRFHRLIVQAGGNRVLQGMWRSLGTEMSTIVTTNTVLRDHMSLTDMARSHSGLLDALRDGDAERAALAARYHFDYFGGMVAASLGRRAECRESEETAAGDTRRVQPAPG